MSGFLVIVCGGLIITGCNTSSLGENEIPTGQGLAWLYPGDEGIENHPAVVFADKFETGSLDALESSWGHMSKKDAQDTLHMRSDVLEIVVANNEPYEGHAAGLSGISELYLDGSERNFFRPIGTGLNFEFLFSGDSTSYDWDRFEPRRAPMELVRLATNKAQLRQPRTENWPLQSFITYELSGNLIEMTYEGIPFEDAWSKHNYIGLFFASYINEPEEKGIHFIGKYRSEEDSDARWIYHLPPEHGREANHRPAGSNWDPVFDEGFTITLASGFSDLEYIFPFYYGISGDEVLIMMFEPLDEEGEMRFAQSPDALSRPYTNPAWDFVYFKKNPVIDEKFSFRVGMMVKKFEGVDDVIEQYEQWSGETVTGWR